MVYSKPINMTHIYDYKHDPQPVDLGWTLELHKIYQYIFFDNAHSNFYIKITKK